VDPGIVVIAAIAVASGQQMRAFVRLGIAVILLVSPISGCAWLECAVLCEQFVAESMHNPVTGELTICGGHVQKNEITTTELDEISACVADHAARGFVLDRHPERP
jgi:hypothetical protein